MPEQTATITRSNWCKQGWHEGQRPKDFQGNPAPTCTWTSDQCDCKCHKDVDEFYRDVLQQPREYMDNPEYRRAERTWVLPYVDYEPTLAETKQFADILPCDRERYRHLFEEPEVQPGVAGEPGQVGIKPFAPTESGVAAKGQLEAQVAEVFNEWLLSHEEWEYFTPKWVSDEIARVQHIKAPSHGAVRAVMDRWVKYNYITVSTKPFMVTGLTEEGKKRGLSALREAWKRTH